MVPDGDSYEPTDGDFELPYGDWLAETPNYQGTVDMRQREYYDPVTIEVGAGPDGLQFDPPAVLVEPGQNIEFEWTGEGGSHNTVEETGLWESELVDESGHTYPIDYTTLETDETRLTEAGVHRYECIPHSDVGMRGAIVVGDIDEVVDDLLHYSVTDADIDRETVESGDTVVVTAEIDVAWIGSRSPGRERPRSPSSRRHPNPVRFRSESKTPRPARSPSRRHLLTPRHLLQRRATRPRPRRAVTNPGIRARRPASPRLRKTQRRAQTAQGLVSPAHSARSAGSVTYSNDGSETTRVKSRRHTVGCQSVPDFVEPVGKIPVHRYNRPYQSAPVAYTEASSSALALVTSETPTVTTSPTA
ncbi:hypothetical protein BRC60_05520, partial [Halobacteriales archaeon QH_1_68_42]